MNGLKTTLFLLFGTLMQACSQKDPQPSKPAPVLPTRLEDATNSADSAAVIILSCIERHGGVRYQDLDIQFTFRKQAYRAIRKNGLFTYSREFKDDDGNAIRDVLSNDLFFRELNGEKAALSPKDSLDFASSVNSVVYFVLQPAFLTDPAVRADLIGTATIKGNPYYKIRVTFSEEGGGKDHEDEFVYWIHQENRTMDYLAYNYLTSGGGARFREGIAFREIAGIRFADYINYKPVPDTREVATFDTLFEAGQMLEVSRIINEDIQVILPQE